jgi:protein O-mannosyl-transferase
MAVKSSVALRSQPLTVDNPPASEPEISFRIALVVALVLAVLVFAVYSRSLGFQFILDDHRFTSDPRIQNADHVWDYFTNFVWAQFTGAPPSFYRPVFLLWMRLNFLLSALSPWGWHFLSIAKHVCVAASLGVLVWRLLRDRLAALSAAAVFAFHPAHTESVSWITVPDPLMTAGILVSLIFYLQYVDPAHVAQSQPKKSRRSSAREVPQNSPLWLLGAAAAYFGALLAKETAILFPLVIFAMGMLSPKRDNAAKSNAGRDISFKERVKVGFLHLLPFALATAIYLAFRLSALDGKLAAVTQHLSWKTVVLSWPTTLWFYVKAIVWPVMPYSFADPMLIQTLSWSGVVVPLLKIGCFAAVLSGVLFWIWRRRKNSLTEYERWTFRTAVITGALLLLLPFLPALNLNALNPGDFLHGRYTYLPLAGVALLLALICHFAGRQRAIAAAALATLALGFIPSTVAQEQQWRDDFSVFTVAHQIAPNNAPVARHLTDAQIQAALLLTDEGRCGEAIPVFEQANRQYPDDWYALAGLGYCYVQSNDLVKAEQFLHRAADLSHDSGIIQQWQELRTHMGLPVPAQSK